MKSRFFSLFRGLAGAATIAAFITVPAQAAFILYSANDTFVVPTGVTSVDILVIGGGGGGASGHQGGGGAGRVAAGTFSVTEGTIFSIGVGAGGTGALSQPSNTLVGLTSGGDSFFGALMSAAGGSVVNQGSQSGSSGGGAGCNAGTLGGSGGSGGSAGQPCQAGGSMGFGLGQGDYSALLALLGDNIFTAGAGGAGGTGSHAGGGGAGGVLLNGTGPLAQQGAQFFSALGGIGYGAGGGAGGYNSSFNGAIRWGGGNGASGMVYVEYDAIPEVPEPASLALVGLGIVGIAATRHKRKS